MEKKCNIFYEVPANNKQKGVALIITFFIMVIILVMVIAISSLSYSELKVVKILEILS